MDFWTFITFLGNSEAYLILIPFVYFLVSRRIGWRILLLTVISAAVVHALKDFFKAPRPPEELRKVKVHGYSFPSGHATGAGAFWSYLALSLKNKYAYIISAMLILLISVSRVVLQVHYIQDIIAGALLGIGISIAFYYLDKKTEKLGEKKKDEGLLVGALIILLASPYLIFKLPSAGAVFLGFGLAHVVVHFLKFEEARNMNKKVVSFLVSVALISFTLVFQNPLTLLITGFASCLVPQALWHFIDKSVEK